MDPQRSTAASTPAGEPYVPHDAAPTWNACSVSPSKSTRTSTSGEGSRLVPKPGAATKKSRSVGSQPGPATSRYPPAPGPVSSGSAAQEASIAATAASTALPPSARTRAPAAAVTSCPAATMPPDITVLA